MKGVLSDLIAIRRETESEIRKLKSRKEYIEMQIKNALLKDEKLTRYLRVNWSALNRANINL